MLRKKGRINRIIASASAVVVAAAVIGVTMYFDGETAYARPTLRGIEDLAATHTIGGTDSGANPFVILEVVDDNLSQASLGYLVGGEEPISDGRSIMDMPSKDERYDKILNEKPIGNSNGSVFDPTGSDLYDSAGNGTGAFTWSSYSEPGTFAEGDEKRVAEIRGNFVDNTGGRYNTTDLSSDYTQYTNYNVNSVGDIYYDGLNAEDPAVVLYRETDAYRVGSGSGNYSFSIVRITDDAAEIPTHTSDNSSGDAVYNYQYFVASAIADASEVSEGALIFSCPSGSSDYILDYVGRIVRDTDDALKLEKADSSRIGLGTGAGELFEEPHNDFYVVRESNENESDRYRIDSVDNSCGPFGRTTGFTAVEGDTYSDTNCPQSKGPYYVASGTASAPYTYVSSGGAYDFKADYSRTEVYETVEYQGGFYNNEWFKKEVFDREDSEIDNLVIDVVPVKISDLTTEMVESAGLIYFAGGSAGYYTADTSDAVARKIITLVNEENLPVIMERSVLNIDTENTDVAAAFGAVDAPNLNGLALFLMHDGEIPTISDDEAWTYHDRWSGLFTSVNKKSHVNGTVFINNNVEAEEAGNGKVVARNFLDEYPSDKTSDGFQDILANYDSEKTYIELYDDWSKFNKKVSKATSIRYILNADRNRAVVKGKLNVLDIEPFATSQYSNQSDLESNMYRNGNTISATYTLTRDTMTKEWISGNIAEHLKGKEAETINLKQMGTKEFIGKNEDLNSTYDLIYIGMDTALMNTDNILATDRRTKVKSTNTVYNFGKQGDYTLDGLVYSHMGDYLKVNNTDWVGDLTDHHHLAGNDLTIDKLRELSEYVEAGYAMILSDSFFDLTKADVTINTTTLDSTSNMYKFIKDVVLAKDSSGEYMYYGKNVFRRGALASGTAGYDRARSTLAKYVNVSKLTIEAVSLPIAYDGSAMSGYIEPNPDGSHTLKYVVKLTNDAAVDVSSTTYDCKLYLDMDADGKYEENESLGGLEINGESEDVFRLRCGNTYTITRNTPEGYVGFLAWKLEFVQNEKVVDATSSASKNYTNVRSSILGYSAIRNTEDRPEIKVLQIIPNSDQTNNLDLDSEDMHRLYDQVKDFKVTVHKVSVGDYIQKKDVTKDYDARNLTYYDYLSKYDMVVVGFADAFKFIAPENGSGESRTVTVCYPDWYRTKYKSDPKINYMRAYTDAILGIREYTLSGRSALFTHDFSSRAIYNTYTERGYLANMYLRDLMGMDRYGLREEANKSLNYYNDYMIKLGREDSGAVSGYKLKEYQSQYDFNKVKGVSSAEKYGVTDMTVLRNATGNTWGITTRESTYKFDIDSSVPNYATDRKETVVALNEGQITQYPFLITSGTGFDGTNSQFEVSSTHPQYLQLNLDTDSRDSNTNDDVVVWYTISNNGANSGSTFTGRHAFYQAMYGDTRNNYYIYSKGNVAYTGSGHSPVSSEQEKKLFVNTLVAAYNSGLHAPSVIYKENPWDGSATVTSTHLPYDPELMLTAGEGATEGGFLDDKLTINFKTLNNNFRESKNSLYVEYYVKDDSGPITIDGNKYKIIAPQSMKMAGTNGALTSVVDTHLLANYRIYQVTFNLADVNIREAANVSKIRNDDVEIYIRIGTEPLELDNGKLPATESMSPIAVYTTKLFDLK